MASRSGSWDPGLLTLQALHALRKAEIIVHDALVGSAILTLAHLRCALSPQASEEGDRQRRKLILSNS